MTGKEAIKLSGRSETWLRNHECSWCGQTLWRALLYGCGSVYERCDPAKKDFSWNGRLKTTSPFSQSKNNRLDNDIA